MFQSYLHNVIKFFKWFSGQGVGVSVASCDHFGMPLKVQNDQTQIQIMKYKIQNTEFKCYMKVCVLRPSCGGGCLWLIVTTLACH